MKVQINNAAPVLNNKTNGLKSSNDNKFQKQNQINFLSNIYYIHPTMNAGESSELRNIYSKLYTNSCEPDVLLQIESLNNQEKESFIKAYCKHTGFPNLKKVNDNMKIHAIKKMEKCGAEANTKILSCGYHNHCSAAKNLALPGSDLDALSAIITGNQDNVDSFNGAMWKNFDPTVVSIRKDFEFPDVFTIDQLYEWTKLTDEIIEKSDMVNKLDKYKQNMKETKDYEAALEFNIDIASEIEKYPLQELQKKAPSLKRLLSYDGKTPKNVTQSISSLLETLRSGHILIKSQLTDDEAQKLNSIKNSYIYNYGNICVQDANYGVKEKLIQRQELINEKNFEKLSTDDKLDLILKMLYESYPSWSKSKVDDSYGCQFEALFDNGKDVNETRNNAFRKTVD